ncbi:uncharacterized protein [Arachis hypogaea]|uniref:uncharacterized protein n=1 Tax=Arachis hypogaea TaxID=3818 RepID=UPI003B2178D2
MAIVLRFVTLDGFVKERFFDVVHVTDTCATTLKKELISVLSHYNLQVENIRGQGYDGASNIRDEWNGLQALFLKDSPQAYYVHCFAHRLQLALVAASRERLWKSLMFFAKHCNNNLKILNAMHIVSTSKLLLQQLRDGGWCNFLANVKDFYEKHEIEVPNMSAQYVFGRGRSRQPSVTVEHHYRIDVFLLQHYQHDIPNHLKGIGTLSELCNKLQETGKSRTYHMVDRLIRLVLTLPVSIATTERAFSAIKIVKTRLQSKMADEFLADNLKKLLDFISKFLVPISIFEYEDDLGRRIGEANKKEFGVTDRLE